MLRAGLMVGIETLKLDITYRCGKKTKTSLFVLFSIRFAYFGFAEGRLHLRKKNKNFVICFVFHSVYTTFGFAEGRLHLRKKKQKLRYLFCFPFGLHYLCHRI